MNGTASVRLLLTGLALLVASAAGEAPAQAESLVTRQQVEAAYLYKFGGYITWPDTAFTAADSPLVIGVAGADELADELTGVVAGRTIANRPVMVRRLHADDPLGGIQILFIGAAQAAQMAGLFESARRKPILVVTEGKDGLDFGGCISFVVVDDHVRFDVSLQAVQQNGLKLSALLLSVAHQISGTEQ